MKKLTMIIAASMLSAATFAQTWTVDKAHAKLGFTVTHLLMSDVDGMFKNFDATITSSKSDFSDGVFNVTAQANSIFTDNEKRDGHLKSPDFFDVEKYATLTFQSKKVTKAGANKLKITGDLTMHGVTKSVTLDATIKGPGTNPMTKKPFAGFKISGKIKRSDFNIGGSIPTAVVSDEVVITANGEFQGGQSL